MAETQTKEPTIRERTQHLLERSRALSNRVAELTVALGDAKADLLHLQRSEAPELLQEFGLDQLGSADGLRLTLKQGIEVAIRAPAKDRAYAWLIENNYGGLIKAEVRVAVDPDDEARVLEQVREALAEELDEANCYAEHKIAPQTLKAWGKERVLAGEVLPEDLFAVNTYQWVDIKTTGA